MRKGQEREIGIIVAVVKLFIFVIKRSTKICYCNSYYNKFDKAVNGNNYIKLSSSVLHIL